MSELTKEYFDQKLASLVTTEAFDRKLEGLATKEDLKGPVTTEAFDQKLASLVTIETFDKKLEGLATKEDLKGLVTNETLDRKLEAQTKELKAYTDDQTDQLGRMIENAFEDHEKNFLQEQFDRLSDTGSLSAQFQTLRLDFKELQDKVKKLEHQRH